MELLEIHDEAVAGEFVISAIHCRADHVWRMQAAVACPAVLPTANALVSIRKSSMMKGELPLQHLVL